MAIILIVLTFLIVGKAVWVKCAISGHGSFDGEKKEIIRRANYLTAKVATSPQQLLDEMPSGIGAQFQGEWAIYSCSMTCAALANIAMLYPQNKETAIKFIGQIIDIAMSEEIEKAFHELREFMFESVYTNPLAKAEESRAEKMVEVLYEYYMNHLDALPELQKKMIDEGTSRDRAVCDYISSMTDRYAIKMFESIYIPRTWDVF